MKNLIRIAYRVQIMSTILAAVVFAAGLMSVGLTVAAQHKVAMVTAMPRSAHAEIAWTEVNRIAKGNKISVGRLSYDKLPPRCGTGPNPWTIPAPAPEWTVPRTVELAI